MKINTKIFTPTPKFSTPKRLPLVWGFLFLSILIVGGFGLGKVEKARADGPFYCTCIGDGHPMNGTLARSETCSNTEAYCTNDCTQWCRSRGWHSGTTSQTPGTTDSSQNVTSIMVAAGASQSDMIPTTVCPGFAKMIFSESALGAIVNCLLLIVLGFLSWILQLAGALFAWIVDPKNMSAVMDNPIIYQIWGQVRDVLNVSFILVLLFSAFCTIFGIDKYSYKKILLTLVIMALLVNFSFPIARFIIDLSNVIMYYFINNLGFNNLSQTFPGIAKSSHLANILNPPNGIKSDTSFLLAAVVFSFIFSVTLLVIAILFLVRVVVLTILIIFSSIAFVGSIVPFLSSQAGKWWDNLFKYAFFGPVMLFMLYIAIQMLGAAANFGGSMNNIASKQSSVPSFVAAMTFFAIPIVILWIGIGFAQQLSIAGAGVARKIGFGAVGWATGVNFGKNTFKAYQARRKEAGATSTSSRLGRLFGSKQDQLRSKIPIGREGKYAGLRYQQDQTRRIEEEKKLHDTEHMSEANLQQLADSGDKFESAAAIIELASRKLADESQLNKVRSNFGSDSQAARQLEDKMIGYSPQAVARDIAGNYDETRVLEAARSGKIKIEDLSVDAVTDNDVMRSLATNGYITPDNWEKLRGKSDAHKEAVQMSLTHIANMKDGSGNYIYNDMNNANHRSIQLANLAQNGVLSESVNSANGFMNQERELYKYANHETLKRSKDWLADSAHAALLGDVKGSNQLGKIVTELNSGAVAHNLAEIYKQGATNAGKHQKYFKQNQSVKNV